MPSICWHWPLKLARLPVRHKDCCAVMIALHLVRLSDSKQLIMPMVLWPGVTTDRSMGSWGNSGVKGTLPASISRLTNLNSLFLQFSYVPAPMPHKFWSLRSARGLKNCTT